MFFFLPDQLNAREELLITILKWLQRLEMEIERCGINILQTTIVASLEHYTKSFSVTFSASREHCQ